KAMTGDFARYLHNPANQENPADCFKLQGEAERRHDTLLEFQPRWEAAPPKPLGRPGADDPPLPEPPTEMIEELRPMGIVIGHGIATTRNLDAKSTDADKDFHLLLPGDEVTLMTLGRTQLDGHDGTQGIPRPAVATFVVTDTWKCEMSEFDANLVFVHIKDL